MIRIKKNIKRTETHGVCSDCISRQAAIECCSCLHPEDCWAEIKALPSVEPERPKRTETMMVNGEPTEIDPLSYEVGYSHGQSERPKGEWVSCSEPPKDRRNVFIAHGTNDFKSCCIGHYEQGMGWYEDRNFFAKPIYDCKYWCDIPELPNLGDNQFGTGVSADMRGDSE